MNIRRDLFPTALLVDVFRWVRADRFWVSFKSVGLRICSPVIWLPSLFLCAPIWRGQRRHIFFLNCVEPRHKNVFDRDLVVGPFKWFLLGSRRLISFEWSQRTSRVFFLYSVENDTLCVIWLQRVFHLFDRRFLPWFERLTVNVVSKRRSLSDLIWKLSLELLQGIRSVNISLLKVLVILVITRHHHDVAKLLSAMSANISFLSQGVFKVTWKVVWWFILMLVFSLEWLFTQINFSGLVSNGGHILWIPWGTV